MSDFLAARTQMALSLGFHIVFSCIGMTMPWLMAAAEWRALRTGRAVYFELARAWSRGVAVFFAVGAVSGTVLSFELGLLWPKFMERAGPVFGLPFAWEGTAFFIEAIAMGLYLYGWTWLSPRMHLLTGVVVGISGVASGVLVIAANAWMNSPAGFRVSEDGSFVDVDPVAAMFNAAWPSQAIHMVLAAFVATSFAVAGVHALRLLRHPKSEFHRAALHIAMAVGALSALLQPLSGHHSAQSVAERQPAKLAAMEALYRTERGAPLLIGGIPNAREQRVDYGIEIPRALSILAWNDPDAEVVGLDRVPDDAQPPVLVTHLAFQLMVGAGSVLALLSAAYLFLRWKRPAWIEHPRFLAALGLATPLGFIAVEAGWTVTEVGRQPFIIYGIMRSRDALTPMPGIGISLAAVTLVYLALTFVVIAILVRAVRAVEHPRTDVVHG